MSEAKICPKCGTELPGDAPAGLCPKCLILAGLESTDESQEQADRGAYEPTALHPQGVLLPEIAALAPHFSQLEIVELLGHGGMGAVYKARQTKLDRLVALKIIRPESADDPAFAERFNREARTLARLSHPNIVAIHDFGEVQISDPEADASVPRTLYYFLMEYVDGANLRELINGGDLQSDQALAIVPQICDALQYAHDEGVVHRDIKPENILLDRKGRVKIADFGLAKLATGSEQDFTLTATHQVMGTLRYMAPEQMEGSHSVDHRADLYSLGVVFYEMLTGEVPVGHFDPPSLKRNIDSRLDRIVLRALARDRDKRYQHASEIGSHVNFIRGDSSSVSVNVSDQEFLDAPFPGPSTMMERAFSGMLRGIRGGAVKRVCIHPHTPAYIAMLLCIAGIATVFTGWALELTNAMQPDAVVYGFKDPCGVVFACFQFLLLLILIAAGTTHERTYWRPWAIMLLSVGAAGWLAIFKVTTLALGDWRIEGGYLAAIGICVALLITGAWDLRGILQSAEQTKKKTPEPIETGPRCSRKAIVAACWAPLFIGIPLAFAPFHHEGKLVWPAPWQIPLAFTIGPLGILAPFATTILGFLALGDIRDSRGKLTGFGLAFFDAFCFPALLLGAVFMLPAIMFRQIYILLVTMGFVGIAEIRLLTHFWNSLKPLAEPENDGASSELSSQPVPLSTPERVPLETSDRVAHSEERSASPAGTDSALPDPNLEMSRLEIQIKGPATAVLVVAILGVIFDLVFGTLLSLDFIGSSFGQDDIPEVTAVIVAELILLIAGGVTIFGALKMRRLESYEWCLTGGILAMIPWTGAVYLISLPIGIWAFRTLRSPEVREAFLTKDVERQQLAQQAPTNELDRQANLLFTTSIINWIGLPVGLAIATVAILLTGDEKLIRDEDTWAILFIAIPCWIVPANAALTVAALKLKRREWYWFSLAGCLLAGVIPPGLFLGLPVGIWTLVLLTSRGGRQEFITSDV